MVSEKSEFHSQVSLKVNKLTRIVLRVAVAIAGFLFLVSVFFPFLSAKQGIQSDVLVFRVEFSSFRGVYWFWRVGWGWESTMVSFSDYWKGTGILWPGGGQPILIFLLLVQILTVAFSAASFLFRRLASPLLVGGLFFNYATLMGMMFFVNRMTTDFPYSSLTLENGFWLSLISIMLFLAALIVSSLWFREK